MAIQNVLTELRDARQALYESVVTLPFDLGAPLPEPPLVTVPITEQSVRRDNDALRAYNEAAAAFVAKCRPWFDRQLAATNRCLAALAQGVTEGFPAVTVEQIVGRWNATSLAEHFPDWLASDRPAAHQRAVVIDRRRQSLEFAEWLGGAISRLESAYWPRVRFGAGGKNNRREVIIDIAGVPWPRMVRSTTERALLALKTGSYQFADTEEVKRFRKDAPEIERLLERVPAKNGRIVRALPEAIRQRIE